MSKISLKIIFTIILLSSAVLAPNPVAYPITPAFIRNIPRTLFFDESKLGIECNTHANCDPPFIVCTGTDENSDVMGVCEHKNLIPMTSLEIKGIVVIIAASMLAVKLHSEQLSVSYPHHRRLSADSELAYCFHPLCVSPSGLPKSTSWQLALRHRRRHPRMLPKSLWTSDQNISTTQSPSNNAVQHPKRYNLSLHYGA